ncbi:MAG TPA: histidine kinase dimerization/phosphoacceptor domain -containing protein, partial [Dissulfurispiraceae bacterium]|nr:histidine kinase dimerization/phosphoacceptor domain -containing protein [Dissulfurispiraceae bacterium]
TITMCNASVRRMFGYEVSEVMKRKTDLLYTDRRSEADRWREVYGILEKEGFHVWSATGKKKDGGLIPLEIIAANLSGRGGAVLLLRDVTERMMAEEALQKERDVVSSAQQELAERKLIEERIKASLREKEVLLKEIHHRVKNNLQVISSMLNLQSRHIRDGEALEMFKESQNRIKSMALIHEKLYTSTDLTMVDFPEYISTLATYLFHSYRVTSGIISLKTDVDNVSLNIDTAIPCGLIVNELISNSLKHAFPPGGKGEIWISLHPDEGGAFTLVIGDDGIGFPEGLDFRNTESLGLQLVNTLVEQLDGSIDLDRSHGTEFRISWKP